MKKTTLSWLDSKLAEMKKRDSIKEKDFMIQQVMLRDYDEPFKITETQVENTETGEIYGMYSNGDKALLFEGDSITFSKLNVNQFEQVDTSEVLLNHMYSLWKDGRKYYTHSIGVDTSTSEIFVIYQAMYDEQQKFYARNFNMFTSSVPEGRESDNGTGQKYRFEAIIEDDNIQD